MLIITQGELPDGGTVCPIILASDKTKLTVLSGDKSAWPVYLTIGNIEKDVRRKSSSYATVLIGYLPVTKLECFSVSKRSMQGNQLFHDAMKIILEPLEEAGRHGVEMVCADGKIRRIFPILAAYVADYPEQALIGCHKQNSCPNCCVRPKEREKTTDPLWRSASETLAALHEKATCGSSAKFDRQELHPLNPFWRDLPHCNIYECITPDIHHQLHKGIFHDHLAKWCEGCVRGSEAQREQEVDLRFRALPEHSDLRHFGKGISTISQWTGKEFKSMEKVFLGVIMGAVDVNVIRAARGAIDFIFYAQFETHTSETLEAMDAA